MNYGLDMPLVLNISKYLGENAIFWRIIDKVNWMLKVRKVFYLDTTQEVKLISVWILALTKLWKLNFKVDEYAELNEER